MTLISILIHLLRIIRPRFAHTWSTMNAPFHIRYTRKTDGEGSQGQEYLSFVPSCCIHREPKIKHTRTHSLTGKMFDFHTKSKLLQQYNISFLFFLPLSLGLQTKIISRILEWSCLLRQNCNNFIQNSTANWSWKGHLVIPSDTKRKFHICNISNRHHYRSTNHSVNHHHKNEKKHESKKNLEPD